MADAADSKSAGGNLVPVQVRPPALKKHLKLQKRNFRCLFLYRSVQRLFVAINGPDIVNTPNRDQNPGIFVEIIRKLLRMRLPTVVHKGNRVAKIIGRFDRKITNLRIFSPLRFSFTLYDKP